MTELCPAIPFDAQAVLFWKYTASIGLLPYQDIEYLYGILTYFEGHYFLIALIWYAITVLLAGSLLFIFKKLFNNNKSFLISSLLFALFLFTITGITTFSRYGISFVAACLFAYLFYYKKQLSIQILLLCGFVMGLLFALIPDQGMTILILWYASALIDFFLKRFDKTTYQKNFYLLTVLPLIGFCVGFLPLVIYLWMTQSLSGFYFFFRSLSELSLLAKTPFIHSLRSTDNLFILAILFATITHLGYKIFFTKNKATFTSYIQWNVLFLLLLFEQKSIIRSIDTQITFIAYFLSIILFSSFRYFRLLLLFTSLGLFVLLHPVQISQSESWCLDSYKSVIEKLHVRADFDGKVFSFPGDPIFYVLLKQKPPYYQSIYEASSQFAQDKEIAFIKNEHIQYIVYHKNNTAIQDDVPNYVRSPFLHAYILTNFSIVDQVGDYLILKKNIVCASFFNNPNFTKNTTFAHSLMNIDLKSIPRSEGYYKRQFIPQTEISVGTLAELNHLLRRNPLSTTDGFLAVSFKTQHNREPISLLFKTTSGEETTVRFTSCEKDIPCIINLSHIPLFYQQRQLRMISSDASDTITTVQFFRSTKKSPFW